ncbi:MAG TPA: rhodanese-like domain-containing protein [Thermoanaerobaculia bacterium]|nr:rhodanese-like domain-containing protein [Thermoanaerobaculia bacterium]
MALKTGFAMLAGLALAISGACGQTSPPSSPLDWPPPRAFPPEPQPPILMSARELAAALAKGEAIPFDVRGAAPFAAGHLPGAAAAWSAGEETSGRIPALLAARGISPGTAVIVYGDGDREDVARFFQLLHGCGCCAAVRVLDGGLAAWRRQGGALETGPSRRAPSEEVANCRDTVTVDSGWVEGVFAKPGFEILDLRDARGWDRWETPPLFAAGHVPYSLPWDPRALLPAGDRWPGPEEVRRAIGGLGPRPGDPVEPQSTFVLYGSDASDPRLGLGYLILSLAGFDVRLFAAGWAGWTEAGARPVVRVVTASEVATLLKQENPRLDHDEPPRGLALFDLREGADFKIGHLPGAQSLPFDQAAEMEKRIAAGWPGANRATLPLLFYCYGADCVRSRKAAAMAAHLGFRSLLWFRGGILAWREAGYPLFDAAVTSASPGSPAGSDARP